MARRLPRVQQAVLQVLAERGRTHAYDIKRVLEGVVPYASVYAALSAVQAKGYATAEWETPDDTATGGSPRKYFEISAAGSAALAAEATRAQAEQTTSPRIATEQSSLGSFG